jgi:hypothetical protein
MTPTDLHRSTVKVTTIFVYNFFNASGQPQSYGQKSQTHRKGLVSGLVISSHSWSLKPQEHVQSGFDDQVQGGSGMIWARMLAYITGTVDPELLLRNEYLAAENRILRAQIKGRLLLSDAEKATLAGDRPAPRTEAKPDTRLA